MDSNILDMIIERTRKGVIERKKAVPVDELKNRIGPGGAERRDFKKSLGNAGRISVIAEIKRASPSAGLMREDFNPGEIIKAYQESGADAVSVVTEEEFFMGDPAAVALVKTLSVLPALVKDFVIDEYQLHEAAHRGADAVLLIAGILTNGRLKDFIQRLGGLGLDALVETRNREEIDKAVSAGAEIIGINNRNLENFEVRIQTSLELLEFIPEGVLKVSESGICSGGDVKMLYEAGADAVLVGGALITAESPGDKLKEIISYAGN